MKELISIEKSIIKKYRKEIYARFVRAIKKFELIEENDNICVCISGGKDSFLMAKCFQELQRHSKYKFNLQFLVMNPGYNKENLDKIIENARYLDIPIIIKNSNIFEVIKNNSNPCFLCARMRRGCLYSMARELGCNKIALGHHFNDVIETILLNQIYNGTFSGMIPIINSDNYPGMQLIRPMYYIHESDIKSWVKNSELTFIDCACIVTQKHIGKRQEIKELVNKLVEYYPNSDINIFNSMFNVNPNTTKYIEKD